jgi:hypothetical protein
MHLGLFDQQGGLWYERFHELGYGMYPPETWPAATAMAEPYGLAVPRELPAGTYIVAARLFSRRTWGDQALANATDSAGRPSDGQLLLGRVEVGPAK